MGLWPYLMGCCKVQGESNFNENIQANVWMRIRVAATVEQL